MGQATRIVIIQIGVNKQVRYLHLALCKQTFSEFRLEGSWFERSYYES